jgi:prepilin-type N-terminal cleavage/methylation domain-containing protein
MNCLPPSRARRNLECGDRSPLWNWQTCLPVPKRGQTRPIQGRALICGARVCDPQHLLLRISLLRVTNRAPIFKLGHCPILMRRRAFTLIELMVAILIFSMVIACIYATWALVIRATEIGQDAAAQAQRERVVLRAIGDALMGVESFQASQNYYWFKLDNGDAPFLSFVARLPDTFPRHNKFVGGPGGPDANSRRVTFSLAAGADGEQDLILRQSPILMDMDDDEKQFPLVLARNVKEFTVEWWGTNDLNKAEWNTEWDDTMTNTIPQMLRVHLVLGANTAKGSQAPVFTATSIYTVPSQMMPVIVQRGIGGLPGGGGNLQAPPPMSPVNGVPGGNPPGNPPGNFPGNPPGMPAR